MVVQGYVPGTIYTYPDKSWYKRELMGYSYSVLPFRLARSRELAARVMAGETAVHAHSSSLYRLYNVQSRTELANLQRFELESPGWQSKVVAAPFNL